MHKNIEEHINKNKTSNRNNSYYNLDFEFDELLVENEIIINFGDSYGGASFRYDTDIYVIKNGSYFIVKNTIFKKKVTITINNPKSEIKFINCKFENDLLINSQAKDRNGENSLIIEQGYINNLIIDNFVANYKFYINPQEKNYKEEIKIDNLKITNSRFIENFKLHNAVVGKFELEDVDFDKNADFFKSEFLGGALNQNEEENTDNGDIGFKAINFKKLALFGDTIFHKKVIFKYVTFEGHNNFKSSILKKGIDLVYTNIQQEINFYDIYIEDKTTISQETYRIIKHQFEKLGNKIEANKYHALELDQKRKRLKGNDDSDWKEKLVFDFHNWSSEHSTNWFRALLWIFIVGLVTNLLTNSLLYLTSFPFIIILSYICGKTIDEKLLIPIGVFSSFILFSSELQFDDVFKFISVFTNEEDFCENYFLMLLNKVSLGYLYYQFVISTRKDTRK